MWNLLLSSRASTCSDDLATNAYCRMVLAIQLLDGAHKLTTSSILIIRASRL